MAGAASACRISARLAGAAGALWRTAAVGHQWTRLAQRARREAVPDRDDRWCHLTRVVRRASLDHMERLQVGRCEWV